MSRSITFTYAADKNPDNTEEVTRHFHLIQQAYEVLIDPQERAWYDKHREAILRGGTCSRGPGTGWAGNSEGAGEREQAFRTAEQEGR